MRYVYIICGLLAAALGAIGAVLPVLPTTPLLIASAFLFAKGSPKLNAWFRRTKLYRTTVVPLICGEGMTRRAKTRALIAITLVISLAFVLMHSTVLRILLAIVWISHVIGIGFVIRTRGAGQKHRRRT